MKKIPLQYYVAYNNPGKCQELLTKFGKPRARDMNDLCRKMTALVVQHRDQALSEIAAIHPDKGLILATNEVEHELEKKSNACGCSSADGTGCGCENCSKKAGCGCSGRDTGRSSSKSNADGGDSPAPSGNSSTSQWTPIVGGLLVLAGVIILLKHA